MIWHLSHRFDKAALPMADRHYNRQKPGTPQFVPPGKCVVLKCDGGLWVSSWQLPQFVKHAWPGAWVNSLFRKECEGIASDFIRQAISSTRFYWPQIPDRGMISFIDPKEVKPRAIRGRHTWGHSYFEAGFKHVGYSGRGLWVFQILAADMPLPEPPIGAQFSMGGAA